MTQWDKRVGSSERRHLLFEGGDPRVGAAEGGVAGEEAAERGGGGEGAVEGHLRRRWRRRRGRGEEERRVETAARDWR